MKRIMNPIRKDRRRRILWVLEFIVTVILLSRLAATTTEYKTEYKKMGSVAEAFSDCSKKTYFYKVIFVASNSKQFSFNLQSSTPVNTFIKIPSSAPIGLFGEYTPGSTCFIAGDLNGANRKLILMFQTAPSDFGNACKIHRIFTTTNLVPCPAETNPIADIFEFTEGLGTMNNFLKFKDKKVKKPSKTISYFVTIQSQTQVVMTEKIMEMLLMHPVIEFERSYDIATISYEMIKKIKSHLAFNSFAKEIIPRNLIGRLVRNGLPGYFLGRFPEGGGANDQEVLQYLDEWESSETTRSIAMNAYLASPEKLVLGETHKLLMDSQGYLVSSTPFVEFMRLQFEFRLVRTGNSQIELSVYEGVNFMGKVTYNSLVTSKFLYVAVMIGHGIIHYDGDENAVSRLLVTTIFSQNQQRESAQFRKDLTSRNIGTISVGYTFDNKQRHTSVTYQSPQGNSINEIGFRVTQLGYTKGSFPSVGFTKNNQNPGCKNKCLIEGFRDRSCILNELLSSNNKEETLDCSSNIFGSGWGPSVYTPMLEACRFRILVNHCIVPHSGVGIVNLVQGESHPLRYNTFKESEYNSLNPIQKRFYSEYTEPLSGVKYLASCPEQCMNPFNLTFIGETCNDKLECLTCSDNIPSTDGECPDLCALNSQCKHTLSIRNQIN